MAGEANRARRWFIALSLAPVAVCVALAFAFAYDAPYWDQWMFVVPIAKTFDGSFGLSDFIVHVNEHVYITPNFITIPLARLTHWNIHAEIATTLLFYLATFGLFLAQLRKGSLAGSFWVAPVIALVLFSFSQHAVWNWGLHVSLAMAVFFVVAALWLLSGDEVSWWQMTGAVAAGFAATFSIGGGLALWPAGVVVALTARFQKYGVEGLSVYRNRYALWSIAMVVAVSAYAAISSGDPTKFVFGVADVPMAAVYVLAFLGGPVAAFSGIAAAGAGAVLVCVGTVLFKKASASPLQRFVLGLFVIAVVAGALTALKHVHEGVDNAISSRFLPWGTLAWCGLAVAAYREWPTVRVMPKSVRAVVVVVLVGTLASSGYGAYKAEERHDAFLLARRALIENPASPDMKFIHPEPETLGERRELLVKYGLTVFRK